jgi:hypothetical protein
VTERGRDHVAETPFSTTSVECRPRIPCAVTFGTPAAAQMRFTHQAECRQ